MNIMRNFEGKGGFRVGGIVINNLRYADDTVIIAETEEELQHLIDIVVKVKIKEYSLQSYHHVTSRNSAPA